MFCKTIILSNSENLTSNAPKGILTLSKENSNIKGKIRLYNLSSLPINTKIGLYVNEKVYISAIYKKPQHYEFELAENIDITQSIYCALIDNSNNIKNVLLEGGSFNGFYFTDSPFDAVLEAKDNELEQSIDEALTELDSCENCSCEKCEYRKYFYDNYTSNEDITTASTLDSNQPYITLDDSNISHIDDINTNSIYDEANLDDISNVNIIENIDLNSTTSDVLSHDYLLNENHEILSNHSNNKTIDLLNEYIKNEDYDTTTYCPDYIAIDNYQSKVINKLQNELIDNMEEGNSYNNEKINSNSINELIKNAEHLLVNNQNLDNINTNPITTDKVEYQKNDSMQYSNNENTDNPKANKEQIEFLNDIIYQLDEMFAKYPEDEMLNSIIPNSRFIKVNNENPYVLGVIYEDKQLKYIAYGVPAQYNSLPPIDFGQHYQWLPLNPHDIMSDGYFMIYQDAVNGTLVEINFEE